MTAVPINYLAVLVATVAGVALGWLWYGPLFGKAWAGLMGFSSEQMAAAKQKGMGKTIIFNIIGTLVMSFTLAHALVFASAYFHLYGASAGLMAGFWNWLGFIAPVTLGAVLWEGKSWRLWFLNNGYYLVTLIVMGLILAGWQ